MVLRSFRPLLLYLKRHQLTSIKFNAAFHQKLISFHNTSYYQDSYSSDNKENINNGEFYKTLFTKILGFGLGTVIGFGAISLKDNLTKINSQHYTIIPKLSAAKPFPRYEEKLEDNKDTTKFNYRKNNNFIADVVEKINDGVVYIEIADQRRQSRTGNALSMRNGSGCIVSSNGLILTNAHVVTNRPRSSTVLVRLHDGREFNGIVEEVDTLSDLAIVRIDCTDLPAMKLGESSDLRPGEFVIALGSPLSLSNTITFGVVSSVGRGSKELGISNEMNYIQTDAAITFGNSGGPLVNLDGEVIGINSLKITPGISFAIPTDYAKEFLTKAKEKKDLKEKYAPSTTTKRRYMGITMLTLNERIIQELQNLPSSSNHPQISSDITHGILVWTVVVGSPAYHAGLKPGDIVTHVNGKEISTARDVYNILDNRGDLRMIVHRKGEKFQTTVSPEE